MTRRLSHADDRPRTLRAIVPIDPAELSPGRAAERRRHHRGTPAVTATILPFQRASDAELTEAWQAYDAARLRVDALYRDEASTSDQRRSAVIEAERLHGEFRRLMSRVGVR